jgi:hypothetical protein
MGGAMSSDLRYAPLGSGPFAATHEAFTSVGTIEWERPAGEVDPEVRESGRRTFQQRALDEQRSLVAFTELLSGLSRAGAPIDVIGSLTRVVRDEALHVDLCQRMVERLGGWSGAAPEPKWVSFPSTWPLQQRVFATVLGSLCLGETLSVALFRCARENATDPVAHQVLTRMLADESMHGRFGWWWLEAMPRSSEAQRFARQFVANVLGSVITDFLPTQTAAGLAEQGLPNAATPYGGVCAEERRDAVLVAMSTIVVPGFEKAGIPAEKAWAAARRSEESLS